MPHSPTTLLPLHTHALAHRTNDASSIRSLTHVIAHSSTGDVDQAEALLLWTIRVFSPETFDAVNKEMRTTRELSDEATKALKEMYDTGVKMKGERDERMRERLRERLRKILEEALSEKREEGAKRLCLPRQREIVDQSG